MEDLVGRDLGPCRVEALLGAGGMGAVYRARHLRLDRPVAVKVLPPSLYVDAAAEARFVQEARLAAKLDDPRIARVYDVGVEGQYRYIVMELVEGATLETLIAQRGPLGQPEAKRLMREILEGLAAAHAAGVVHRDVKPSNVMIDRSARVRILDFGLAAAQNAEQQAETVGGSFHYMAPEQIFAPKPDPRMDLYAWAATYFYLLTGRPPFVGSANEVLILHREHPAPDVRTLNREVTDACARLLLRCMAKFPDERPANAAAALAEMDKTGFLLDVDASGSPFKILPPPVAAREGFQAPAGASAAPAAVGPAIPPPPPPVEAGLAVSPAAWVIFAGLWAFFFGRPWARAVEADWTAGCVLFGAAGALLALAESGPGRRPAGAAILAGLAVCFLGASRPLGAAAAEVWILAGLAFATAAAGVYLGLLDAAPDGRSGAGLIAVGALGLAAAAAAQKLSPAESWLAGVPGVLRARWADWSETGGAWRWGGVLALYLCAWTVRLSGGDRRAEWARKTSSDGRILNWNR